MEHLKKYKLFSIEECGEIIEYLNNPNISWHKTFKPSIFTHTTSTDLWFNLKIRDWISTQFKLKLEKHKQGFTTTCFKYYKGGEFPEHIDHVDDWGSYPLYNINIILNSDFEGGNFFLNNIVYDTKVGYIYKYKSTEKHGVHKVTNGIRYMLTCHVFNSDLIESKKTLL